MSAACWQLRDGTAQFAMGRVAATVDPALPNAGLAELRVDGAALFECRPLAIDLGGDCAPPEVIVRGGDLVATYTNRPAREMRSQIYWRAATHALDGALAAIEVVISVQTELLDSSPAVSVSSEAVNCEVFRLLDVDAARFARVAPLPDWTANAALAAAPRCFLFRSLSAPVSYAEMVFPGESQTSEWQAWLAGGDSRIRLAHRMFSRQLEKGVILRSRVLGVWLPRAGDEVATVAHYRSFLAADLPLTT